MGTAMLDSLQEGLSVFGQVTAAVTKQAKLPVRALRPSTASHKRQPVNHRALPCSTPNEVQDKDRALGRRQ